ncbi:MAG: hypothetical protein EBZ77_13670, partial [Chitinophagia bacterium]|nr:hypothetical protein [Chitinophagia bacterium]
TGGELVLMPGHLLHEPGELLHFLIASEISRIFLPAVGLQLLATSAEDLQVYPRSLNEVYCTGDALRITPVIAAFFTETEAALSPVFTLPECQVVSCYRLTGDPTQWPLLPSVGYAIPGVDIYLVDEQLNLVDGGNAGEIYVAGPCLAEGYINNQELTFDRFIFWEHPEKGLIKIFRSGELASRLPIGAMQCLGRKDNQVNIMGHSIAPVEIEEVLSGTPGIRQAAVRTCETSFGERRLYACLVSSTGEENTAEIRRIISRYLPGWMMPSAFIWLPNLPVSPHGHVEHLLLPLPPKSRPELATPYQEPVGEWQMKVALAFETVLDIEGVGALDNFFELGGHSLATMQLATAIRKELHVAVRFADIYRYATVETLAAFLQEERVVTAQQPSVPQAHSPVGKEVAVIGMAFRLPGAQNLEQLWELLQATDIDKQRINNGTVTTPNSGVAAGTVYDPTLFDPAFFGIEASVAPYVDPQLRLLLELGWEVLEQTGYAHEGKMEYTGVYLGVDNNNYLYENVLPQSGEVPPEMAFEVYKANKPDYFPGKVAAALGLNGPAMNIQGGDATAALAIVQAVQAIRNGDC